MYCQRGDVENCIKELHDLEIDRTSCSRFWANQFRVLLTAAAYVLLQELRLRAAGTACARAQVCMLRERLLKLGARVRVSVRRIVVHLGGVISVPVQLRSHRHEFGCSERINFPLLRVQKKACRVVGSRCVVARHNLSSIRLTSLKSVIGLSQIVPLVAIMFRSIHNSVAVPLFMHNCG